MHFISHSSLDKAAALDLRDRLLARGYDAQQLFLDSDEDSGIAAGAKWEQVLYERLKDCRALVVLCSPHWQQSKWCFAELVYAKMAGKEVFPVVLADCDLSVASEHQAVFVNKEGEAAFARLLDTLESRHLGPKDHLPWPPPDLRDIHSRPDDCPFPGLPAFDERYAAVYFGRERETQTVLEELRQMRSKGEPRLLMIVGGSGSGKSSLLMAGVLPRLKHTTSRSDWLVLSTMRIGRRDYPDALFESLSEEIVARYPPDAAAKGVVVPDRKTLRDQFAADDATQAAKAFLDAARDLTFACGCKDATVLLPVDQFEEFLPPSGGANGTKFLQFLEQVCQHRNDRLLVIGTMRSDYLDVYERHPHALKAPTFNPWRLEPFPREQITNVIVKPAARAHVVVTSELLEQLKQETPTTDALPLLAFTLEKLYRAHSIDKKLDLDEYKSLGGMEGSIKHTAEQIMRAKPLPANVESAVRLSFVKHLAQVNDKGEFVRLTARWNDLEPAAFPILEQFVTQRLLIKSERDGEGTLEVAHEALFRSWEQLKTWLGTSADILRWRRDVRRDQASDKNWHGLRPAQLAVARDWPKRRRDELSQDEVKWIKQGSFRVRLVHAAIAVVIVLVMSFGAAAWYQNWVANEALSDVTRAEKIALEQLGNALWHRGVAARDVNHDAKAAVLFAESAKVLESAAQIQLSESSLMAIPRSFIGTYLHDGPIRGASFVDETQLLTWSEDGTARLWDIDLNQYRMTFNHDDWVLGAVHALDGTRVLTWSTDHTARLWDVGNKESIHIFQHDGIVLGGLMSKDASRVLTWSEDGTARIWSTKDGRAIQTWQHGNSEYDRSVRDAVFLAEDSQVLTLCDDGTARLWRIDQEQPIRLFSHDSKFLTSPKGHGAFGESSPFKHQDTIDRGLAVSDDASYFLTWGYGGAAWIWAIDKGEPIRTFESATWIKAAILGKERSRVVTWDIGGHVSVWNLENDNPSKIFVHSSTVGTVQFDPAQDRIVTSCDDGKARIWDCSNDEPVDTFDHFRPVQCAAFLGTTSRIATCTDDGFVWIWGIDVNRPEQPTRFPNEGRLHGFVSNEDDSLILIYGKDGAARLWRTRSEAPVREFSDTVVRYSAGGDSLLVLTRSKEGINRLWDLMQPDPIRTSDSSPKVDGICLSPDGRHLLLWGDGITELLDHPSGARTRTFESGSQIVEAFFSSGGNSVVTWDEHDVKFWKFDRQSPLTTFHHEGHVLGVAIDSTDSHLLSWSDDGNVRMWSIDANRLVKIFHHGPSLTGASLDLRAMIVLTWGWDVVRIWDVQSNEQVHLLRHDEKNVIHASSSADPSQLVTWCDDGSARLWKRNVDVPVRTFHQRELPSFGISTSIRPKVFYRFSNGGSRLLTWSNMGSMSYWDVNQELPIKTFGRETGPLSLCCAAITANEAYLIGYDLGHSAKVWHLAGYKYHSAFDAVLDQEVLAGATIDKTTGTYRLLTFDEWLEKRDHVGMRSIRQDRMQ